MARKQQQLNEQDALTKIGEFEFLCVSFINSSDNFEKNDFNSLKAFLKQNFSLLKKVPLLLTGIYRFYIPGNINSMRLFVMCQLVRTSHLKLLQWLADNKRSVKEFNKAEYFAVKELNQTLKGPKFGFWVRWKLLRKCHTLNKEYNHLISKNSDGNAWRLDEIKFFFHELQKYSKILSKRKKLQACIDDFCKKHSAQKVELSELRSTNPTAGEKPEVDVGKLRSRSLPIAAAIHGRHRRRVKSEGHLSGANQKPVAGARRV